MIDLHRVADVRAAEDEAMAVLPDGVLMQRAAFGLATEIVRVLREQCGRVAGSRAVILVGSGNNGGDALYAGYFLIRRGVQVTAFTVEERWHEEGAIAFRREGGRLEPFQGLIGPADVIVDGLVGIGARGPLRPTLVRAVRVANKHDAVRIAVDLPSGIDPDDGTVVSDGVDVFRAGVTVTFGCAKTGLFRMPASEYVGDVRIIDIGLAPFLPPAQWRVVNAIDVGRVAQEPEVNDYKYSRGVVGLAVGGADYPGAAILAVGGARVMGAGMTVVLDRDDQVAERVVSNFPDVVKADLQSPVMQRVSAWACGPGMLGDSSDAAVVEAVLQTSVPVVLDAGALSVLSNHPSMWEMLIRRHEAGWATVLTPHAGELRRLTASSSVPIEDCGAFLVEKGPKTRVLGPGGRGFVDSSGTASLSCAGSGDVLAGMIAGLLACNQRGGGPIDHQAEAGPDAEEVVALRIAAAVWLHGRAGQEAATGGRPVLATDVVRSIPNAIAAARVESGCRTRAM